MRSTRIPFLLAASLVVAAAGLAPACSDGSSELTTASSSSSSGGLTTTTSHSGSTSSGGGNGGMTGTGGAGGVGVGGMGGMGGGGGGSVLCPTVFSFKPPPGATNLRVAGEWQGFDLATAPALSGPDPNGLWSTKVELPIGLQAYKIVYDQNGSTQWVLDPAQGRRKYLGGIENSAVKVADCRLPGFTVVKSEALRPAPGQGSYGAQLGFQDGIESSGPDAGGFSAVLVKDGVETPLDAAQLQADAATGEVKISVSGLEDGKYTLVLRGKTKSGKVGDPLRLVFWIEAEAFSWKDAIIYMAMTDRFKDGDPSNNPAATPGADPRGDWKGGDLEGLRQKIADGTLDKLGVRAIWLTPLQTNPTGAYLASDGFHKVTGYHGYWPVKAREVEPRIGGEVALRALVKEAHAHGIRILQDFVLNHVHEDHEYVKAHPEWFHTVDTGCICGTNNCDWTAHALDCLFASYMPDIDHKVPEASAQFTADAIWWLDTFDLDGVRVDAVKHVEEVATRNLAAEVRETFESAGTRYFLMGETAMGWNDCGDPCNDENYGTIAKYVGPLGLDGQFDFVLYHGVSYRTFAYGDKGMFHADYWFTHGMSKWPAGAIMTPYIGSHDTARFATLADYRGQDPEHDRGIPGNQWDNTAAAPKDAEPYRRTRIGMAWLLNLPGAPLLYYGDEYGQWGGADPNNRLLWRDEASLDANELETLNFVRKIGTARRNIPALRRGDYVSLAVTEDTLVFGRKVPGDKSAIVAFTRAGSPQMATVDVTAQLGIPALTTLHDAMGGPDVPVAASGKASLTIPAGGAVVLTP